MSPGQGTLAVRTLDCATKVRVHYRLVRPLDVELASRFPEKERRIDVFSRFVAGARDHLTLSRPEVFHATGTLGLERLVVTFGKADRRFPAHAIAEFEAHLAEAGYGPVLPHVVCTETRSDRDAGA